MRSSNIGQATGAMVPEWVRGVARDRYFDPDEVWAEAMRMADLSKMIDVSPVTDERHLVLSAMIGIDRGQQHAEDKANYVRRNHFTGGKYDPDLPPKEIGRMLKTWLRGQGVKASVTTDRRHICVTLPVMGDFDFKVWEFKIDLWTRDYNFDRSDPWMEDYRYHFRVEVYRNWPGSEPTLGVLVVEDAEPEVRRQSVPR